MITTLLKLAKLVKESPEAVQYHEYARQSCYADKKGRERFFYSRIIVNHDFSLTIDPQPYQNDSLIDARAMVYKACPSDTSKKRHFIFGDILVTVKEGEITSASNLIFDLKDPSSPDTFDTATQKLFPNGVDNPVIAKFRKAVSSKIHEIKKYISTIPFTDKQNCLFIHFDFSAVGKEHWYEFEDVLPYMDNLMLSYFENGQKKDRIYVETPEGYVLTKTFIHTLCSGHESNDEQSPGFQFENRYKCFTFKKEERSLIFYTGGVLESCEVFIPKCSPYVMRVLPNGEGITYSDFRGFKDNIPRYVQDDDKQDKAEKSIQPKSSDIFECYSPPSPAIVLFDTIFVVKGGMTKPDVDVLEISNLSRSYLAEVLSTIQSAWDSVATEEKWKPGPLCRSFFNILRVEGKDQYKYKHHMMRVLPQILLGTYGSDPGLLPYMLERISRDLRNGKDPAIKSQLTNFRFITKLQKEGSSMIHKESEELGKQTASVAFPLKLLFGSNFEKRIQGFITRRASRPDKIRSLLVDWEETINRHLGERKENTEIRLNTYALLQARSILKGLEETKGYDVYSFAEGFFDQINKLEYITHKKQEGDRA